MGRKVKPWKIKSTYVIGIAGGSASGKTSIAQSIYDRFKAVISKITNKMITTKIKVIRQWKKE